MEEVDDRLDDDNGIIYLTREPFSRMHKAGMESAGVPDWEFQQSLNSNRSLYLSEEPILNRLTFQQLWGDACTPQGRFITHLVVKDAFHQGWRFVKSKNAKDEVDRKILNLLLKASHDYHIKMIHIRAVHFARAFGGSLVIKAPRRSRLKRRKKAPYYLRVIPFHPRNIIVDAAGDPLYFNARYWLGHRYINKKLPAHECIYYQNDVDPFGNGLYGIPELYTLRDYLKWEMNINRGMAEALDARGISMLHLKIKGFDINDKEKWEDAYGNPSLYRVLFTDEYTEANNVKGVEPSFQFEQLSRMYSKKYASGTGIPIVSLEGSSTSKSDSSAKLASYHSILSMIQEQFEDQLIELYELVEPNVIGKFELSFDIEPKLDLARKAQILTNNVNAALGGKDFMTYNQILRLLQLEPVEGGDINAEVYIYNMKKEAGILDMQQEQPKKTYDELGQKLPDGSKTDDKSQHGHGKDLSENRGGNRDKRTIENLEEIIPRIKEIVIENGCLKNKSYTEIQKDLFNSFGSGVSDSKIAEINKNILKLKRQNNNLE